MDDAEEPSRDYLSGYPCVYVQRFDESPHSPDSCLVCCSLISETNRGNVAQRNPIGIDFNQDNVPVCLITVSERHEMDKDHLPNVPEACVEQNC